MSCEPPPTIEVDDEEGLLERFFRSVILALTPLDHRVEDRSEESDDQEDGGGGGVDESISVTITEPRVLDCMICYDPLTIPIFQCKNGHIICQLCCSKLRNKCPSCRCLIESRCRAMENVLVSLWTTCQYTEYGCTETMSYNRKCSHEKYCNYTPCSCPLSDCDFVGSQKKLNRHFTETHKDSAIKFRYDRKVSNVILRNKDQFLVLQEEKDGTLFILNNCKERYGSVISIGCIAPTLKGSHFYDILAKPKETTLRFQTYTTCIQERVNKPPSVVGLLLIPSDSFDSYGDLKLDLCIWRCGSSPQLSQGQALEKANVVLN